VFAHVPVCQVEELATADAILFVTPTRFGNLCGQMRNFLDQTGALWARGAFVGKVGSVFNLERHAARRTGVDDLELPHHPPAPRPDPRRTVPYTFEGQSRLNEITGGSPYGASTIAGSRGERRRSENELETARFQGEHVARIASKMMA
jgi:NAD(P)H dehydrogenase (quinone)